MVANIRRFKGMSGEDVKPQSKHKICIDGNFADWDGAAAYEAIKGNTIHRNSRGWGDYHYINNSGRNDIVGACVAHDAKNIYFYVECASAITSPKDNAWMRLYINTDRKATTGWEGYDYILNRTTPSQTAVLEHSAEGWAWSKAGDVEFKVDGCRMEVAIPRKALQLDGKKPFEIEFKWVDNSQVDGDIYDFYISGDAAPLGRFNYLYKAK
jgi:hypothetical protein